MYTLILIWGLGYSSNAGTESLQVPNLSYQECNLQISNFQANTGNLRLLYGQCINQGDVRQ